MRRNHSTAGPRRVVTLDCVSMRLPIKNQAGRFARRMRLAVARHVSLSGSKRTDESRFTFHRPEPVWNWVRSYAEPRQLLWIVVHDARSVLQLTGLWRELDAGRLLLDTPRTRSPTAGGSEDAAGPAQPFFVFSNPPVILRLRTPAGHRIQIVDTENYGRATLAEMADDHGLTIPERPDATGEAGPIAAYLESTTAAIEAHFLGLVDYVSRHNLGRFRWTAAGQADSAFRHRWLRRDVLETAEPDIKARELQAYYGGWVQPFAVGKLPGPVYHLDINGLYPWVMARTPVPIKLLAHDDRQEWRPGPPPVTPRQTLAEVQISSDTATYPVRIAGKMVMAIGDFCTTLAGPELQRAVSRGHVVRHARWLHYQCDILFDRWADELHQMRLDARHAGRKPQERYAKLLLNSLHGKFAQQAGGWLYDPAIRTPIRWGAYFESDIAAGTRTQHLAVAGAGFRKTPRSPKDGTFPAIAAWIASAAREAMRWWIETIGPRHVYYLGVDSLICDWRGHDMLAGLNAIDPERLGGWKLQGHYNSATIIGAGNYMVGDQLTVCGRKDAAWTEDGGIVVQAISPSMETLLATRQLGDLPESEYRRSWGDELARAESGGIQRITPRVLQGHALRLYDGSSADWPINGTATTTPEAPRPRQTRSVRQFLLPGL